MTGQQKDFINSESIFKIFPPAENVIFSSISSSDILDLVILLKNYYLTLRNSLNLSKKVSFGVELEFSSLNDEMISFIINKMFSKEEWQLKNENTVKDGLEIASDILIDTENSWQTLKQVCDVISPYAKETPGAGAHVHIGAHVLGSNKIAWLNLMKLWSVYENIIFRFSYNEHLTARPLLFSYAPPIAKYLWEDYQIAINNNYEMDDLISFITRKYSKEHALTFSHVSLVNFSRKTDRNTIEFRVPNGTLNPIIWQNNINLFAKMLLYAKNPNFNHDIIDKRYEEVKDMFHNLNYYNEIFLEQALEFSDLVFTNNIDKLNFLKQYLKNYKLAKNRHDYESISLLTKSR